MAITFDFLMEVLAAVSEYYKSLHIAYLDRTRSIMNLLRPPALNLNYVREDTLPLPVYPYWSGSFSSYRAGEHSGLNTVSQEVIRYFKSVSLNRLLPWDQD